MTTLLYLEDFNVVSCTATVEKVSTLEDGRYDVVLDATCFYPKGGGQDWDEGTIATTTATFRVEEVRADEHGHVHHVGVITTASLGGGDVVSCAVDRERRKRNTILHSAGHLIDIAVDHLGLPWVPGKGAHFPHMSFVEYDGPWDSNHSESMRRELQDKVNLLVERGGTNSIRFVPYEEMASVCRHVPDYIPAGKPGRVVVYGDDFGIPCGGTHVADLSEIGHIQISKIRKRSGVIRVSYSASQDRASEGSDSMQPDEL